MNGNSVSTEFHSVLNEGSQRDKQEAIIFIKWYPVWTHTEGKNVSLLSESCQILSFERAMLNYKAKKGF